jgi:PEP-CTERM motif
MKPFAGLAVMAMLAAGSLSASVVQCPTSATLQELMAFNSADNACFSQDKLYWDFNYTPGPAAPDASGVTSSLIFTPLGGIDIHGWNFSSVWSQGVAGLANFSLGYTIEVCPSSVPECAGNVAPGTVITEADGVYAPVSTFPPGPETVSWSNGASVMLTSGSPGPLPSNGDIGLGAGITGPISVTADFSGTGAITQTTLRFYQTVPRTGIPEPATLPMIFGGLGLIGLGCYRRTKRTF